ncbi:MAG: helix-hairpin-helix domain-containing protein [Chloroflexota bacterium]|nr:helix-hairpin-helix domain-containing protein [Chloroflexota bacterium]
MSDFLEFLNTADVDRLTSIPGINRSLAGELIAARPFEVVEDSLKVRGMGKNLLARIQSAFEERRVELENRSMVPAEPAQEEMPPAPIEKFQPAMKSSQEPAREAEPTFLSRLGRGFLNFTRALLRLILLVLLISAVGAALYFGLPYLNNTFMAPVEQNAARVGELETRIENLQTELSEMDTRVGAIETSIEAHTAGIEKLEKMQVTLEQEAEAQANSVMITLKREIMLTRAIETLSRARLYLSQSNFGLAKIDVQSARSILAELSADAPSYQVDALDQIIGRLDLALGNLPAFPIIAVDDVDIAWQLLMMGLPESEADIVATLTPLPPPTRTSTAEATATLEDFSIYTQTPAPPPAISPTVTP